MKSVTVDSSVSWSATYGSVTVSSQNGEKKKSEGADGAEVSKEPMTWKQRITSPAFLRAANLALMVLAIVGYGMCVSLFAPFFPTEAEKRGVSSTVVGLIFSCYTIFLFIGTPLSGLLVRHLGIYYMIGAGMFLAGGATVLFGFLDQSPPGDAYVALCFAVRIIEGCGVSMYMSASYSTAAALYPENVSFVYAIVETGNNIGRMIGPSAGGLLFNLGGFSLPFFVVGSLLIVIGLLSLVLLKASSTIIPVLDKLTASEHQSGAKKQATHIPWSHYFKVSVHAWVLSFSQAVTAIIFTFPEPTLSVYFAELGLTDPAIVGIVFLAASAVYTVFCLSIGKTASKLERYSFLIMAFGAFCTVLGNLIFGPTPLLQNLIPPSVGGTAAGLAVVYIGVAFLLCSVPQALSSSIRAAGYPDGIESSSLIATIYNGMWFGGGCFGPTISGALMDSLGFELAATVIAGLAAVLLVVLISAHIAVTFCCKTANQYGYGELDRHRLLESSHTISMPKW